METDEKRLARLKGIANTRGLDISRAPEGGRESGRGWRLVYLSDKSHVVVVDPADGRGATLDEIEFYLDRF
jgi:hypothetical protein